MNSRFYFLLSIFFSVLLLSTFYFLFSLTPVLAAELKFDSQMQEFGVDQMFQADLFLDAQNEEINAIEGKVIFPKDLLEIKEILEGSSIINFWVEKPRLENNEIIFSGIIPGGFKGVLSPYYEGARPGKILSLILKTKTIGEDVIDLKDTRVLLNDGFGTPVQASVLPFQFKITSEAPHIMGLLPIKDPEPPEPFEPVITQDPNVFNNQWFLVFATQDKGSGISHYEIQENRRQKIENRKWITAESPYVLKDQKLKSYIYIKAVDKAGNEKLATLPPRYPLAWYENYFVWVKIIIGIILAIVIGYILRKRLKNLESRK